MGEGMTHKEFANEYNRQVALNGEKQNPEVIQELYHLLSDMFMVNCGSVPSNFALDDYGFLTLEEN
jgi:hypothetical protein